MGRNEEYTERDQYLEEEKDTFLFSERTYKVESFQECLQQFYTQ
jgi:hypothetical protein